MTTLAWSSRATPAVGQLLREWRERRRLSQLDLSIQADISARHLSFVETGRSQPTSGMILRLSEQLDVPLRERNALLLAGGYAPAYPEHSLDEPELGAAAGCAHSVQILTGHEPYPALVGHSMVRRCFQTATPPSRCSPTDVTPHCSRRR